MALPISKRTLTFVIVAVLIAVGYFYFSGGEEPTDYTLVPGSNFGATANLSLLNQLKSLKIDAGLFKDPAYLSLIDRSVPITPQAVGRPDPFAPVPGVPNPAGPGGDQAVTPSFPQSTSTPRR